MKRTEEMPGIVYIGLVGVGSKAAAYAYMIVCVLLGVASIIYAQRDPVFYSGGTIFVAAFWYYYSIRWVDKHSSWG